MQGRRGRESAFDIVSRALTPCLGANMARAIARGHCDKLGIHGDTLDADQLALLTSALRPGLNVFVGHNLTDAVLAQIERELMRGGDADA